MRVAEDYSYATELAMGQLVLSVLGSLAGVVPHEARAKAQAAAEDFSIFATTGRRDPCDAHSTVMHEIERKPALVSLGEVEKQYLLPFDEHWLAPLRDNTATKGKTNCCSGSAIKKDLISRLHCVVDGRTAGTSRDAFYAMDNNFAHLLVQGQNTLE